MVEYLKDLQCYKNIYIDYFSITFSNFRAKVKFKKLNLTNWYFLFWVKIVKKLGYQNNK
jgi:hypothetical protein